MNAALEAALRSWPLDPWLLGAVLTAAAIYLRGWLRLRSRDPQRWPVEKPLAYCGGLGVLYVALASPIEPFASLLLQVHMLQHLLLMMVAPPLIWLGSPLLPLLAGLPQTVRRDGLAPFLRSPGLRAYAAWLTHPAVALPLFTAATWLWHSPAVYDAALRRPWLHVAQHASFLGAALLFWFPVVRPFPARPRWSAWLLLPYLLLADVQNTVLAAFLSFSPRVVYSHYESVPRLGGLSALADQQAAGVLMWVPGSIAFLVPLLWIGVQLFTETSPLSPSRRPHERPRSTLHATTRKPAPAARRFDLLRVPLLGALLRWRHARIAVQLVTAMLAALIVYDGLTGPQVAAMNLAGVLPWIHWRGLLVLGLLAAGNFACFACPFTLARRLTDRWLPPGRPWPRRLRNKWLAVLLLGVFLWSYEAFSLWDSPWLTAWIVIGYFIAAFLVDTLFRRGSFCKFVCPIGQFNFIQSLASPLEVRARNTSICSSCVSQDCLRGNLVTSGCQLQLFLPRKEGNADCTFCLDCVAACPHENVGILAVTPTETLWRDPFRSGIGRFSRRTDLAALTLLLVFGAFANAAGMVGPVVEARDRLTRALGQPSHLLATSLFYAVAIVLLPIACVAAAAMLGPRTNDLPVGRREWLRRSVYALVPLGFAMWLAHYGFHFATSWQTILPVAQRFCGDLGWPLLGVPRWACACCIPAGDGLLIGELLLLDAGLLASLLAAWKIARQTAPSSGSTVRLFLPWGTIAVALFSLGVWIVFQPMEMRGTLPGTGGPG